MKPDTLTFDFKEGLTEEEMQTARDASYALGFIIAQDCDDDKKGRAIAGVAKLMIRSRLFDVKASNKWDDKYEEVANEKGDKYATVTLLASMLSAISMNAGLFNDSEEEAEKEVVETMEKIMPRLKEFPKGYVMDAFDIIDIMKPDESIYQAADRFYAGKESESDVAKEAENN